MGCIFLILIVTLTACKSQSQGSDATDNDNSRFSDGVYCAEVVYSNPNTGTRSTYTLNVEVEDQRLTKIYWPNGGWLDDSHFSPPEVDEEGTCAFTTDKGYRYSIDITGPECSTTASAVTVEGADEPREVTMTLAECAAAIQMSEEELADYESTFNESRDRTITEKMCNSVHDYILKIRPIRAQKEALEKSINDGYIQKILSVGSEGHISCQMMIIKRRGTFYLLQIAGQQKATMGLAQFDPSITGWQEVITQQDPAKMELNVFNMRIVDQSESLYLMEERIKTLCGY